MWKILYVSVLQRRTRFIENGILQRGKSRQRQRQTLVRLGTDIDEVHLIAMAFVIGKHLRRLHCQLQVAFRTDKTCI